MIAQVHLPKLGLRSRAFSLGGVKHAAEGLLVSVTAVFVALALFSSGTSPTQPSATVHVKVQQGDTLWDYARKYGNPDVYILKRVDEIAQINKLEPSRPLVPGQELIIPVGQGTVTAEAEHKTQ
jgi:nucleoid-associated protein YgaU